MQKKRIACIDFGLARLGLAISDESKIIASTLGMIPAEKTSPLTAKKVAKSLSTYNLEKIVVGLPLHMNGKKGFMADEVLHFIEQLRLEVSCEVVTLDERLSTLQAERMLKEANLSRKKRAQVIDGVSAALLLQNYLDFLSLKSIL